MGQKIDIMFVEIIEAIVAATFKKGSEKLAYVERAVFKLDSLKILLMVLWESKALDNKKYSLLSTQFEEIGKMLGGWYGHIIKQNSPKSIGEK